MTFEPVNLILDSEYAHMDANKTCPNVPQTDTSKVLKIYLVKGTQESDIRRNKSVKFLNVGFLTKILGGKIHNSFKGFKEQLTAYTIGISIKTAKTPTMKNRKRLPPKDLLSFFCFKMLTRHPPLPEIVG